MIYTCVVCKTKFEFIAPKKAPNRTKSTCSGYCKGKLMWRNMKDVEGRNKKISDSREGSKNPIWKGDQVSYGSLHTWIKNHKPKPEFCVDCKVAPPKDLANISQEYKRDILDFEWLCRRCHMRKDGRMRNLKYQENYDK